MRNLSYCTLLLCFATALLLSKGAVAQEQAPNDMQRLTAEVCACMGRVDLKSSDADLDAAVRTCLEDAVVHHPKAVTELLRNTPPNMSKGYQLGVVLGKILDRHCPVFPSIKERLRRINADSPLLKSAS